MTLKPSPLDEFSNFSSKFQLYSRSLSPPLKKDKAFSLSLSECIFHSTTDIHRRFPSRPSTVSLRVTTFRRRDPSPPCSVATFSHRLLPVFLNVTDLQVLNVHLYSLLASPWCLASPRHFWAHSSLKLSSSIEARSEFLSSILLQLFHFMWIPWT